MKIYIFNFKFKKNKKIDVLVWNTYNADFICHFLSYPIKYDVIEISKLRVDFLLEFKFFFTFLKFLKKNSFSDSIALSFIKIYNPECIVTYNSTTPFKENILNQFKGIKYFNIQYCLEEPSHSLSKYQNYIGWGFHSEIYFKQNLINYTSYNVLGSLKLAYFLETNKIENKNYDVAFISTYRYVYDTLDLSRYSKNEQTIFLSRFQIINKQLNAERNLINEIAKKTDLKSCLLLSNSEKSDKDKFFEINYYSCLSKNIDILPKVKMSSYVHARSSNIIITTNSALGFEMLAIGKRVIFLLNSYDMIDFHKHIGLADDYFKDLPSILVSSTNIIEVFNKINYLNSLNDKDYIEITNNARNFFCINPNNTKKLFLNLLNIKNDYK